jgi:hypothetical protein
MLVGNVLALPVVAELNTGSSTRQDEPAENLYAALAANLARSKMTIWRRST